MHHKRGKLNGNIRIFGFIQMVFLFFMTLNNNKKGDEEATTL